MSITIVALYNVNEVLELQVKRDFTILVSPLDSEVYLCEFVVGVGAGSTVLSIRVSVNFVVLEAETLEGS